MKLSITVISLCLVQIVWGQILNLQGGDTLPVNSNAILNLQSRLSAVEYLRNEDALRIADLSKQQQIDQRRLSDLETQQQIDQRRIADLEKQQQIDRSSISDLVNKRDEDNRTIADLEQKQQDDHVRIADIEKKRQDDQKRIANLEKQQRFYIGRIADLEKNLRDGDKRQVTYSQEREQQHLIKLDSDHKFPFDSFTNSTASMIDVRRIPSVKKTRNFDPFPRKIPELPRSTLETSNQGINQKRVSPDKEFMVAFYAALTHVINPVANLIEIHFDHVITNIGGSYSGNTGTFTCTHTGVYVFSWTVHVYPRYMYTELVKNGVVVGNAFSGQSQYDGIGGGTVIVELNQGDEVWVRVRKHYTGSYIYFDGQTTTFSGFLL